MSCVRTNFRCGVGTRMGLRRLLNAAAGITSARSASSAALAMRPTHTSRLMLKASLLELQTQTHNDARRARQASQSVSQSVGESAAVPIVVELHASCTLLVGEQV